jgi:UDP:flavonoid glycosyltransferase YjiC (YdhE family)
LSLFRKLQENLTSRASHGPLNFITPAPFYDNEGRKPIYFPWEMLTDGPLIYASLGSFVNGLSHIYKAILQAVATFPAIQVVLSVGRNINSNELGPIPPNTIIVTSAPQIENVAAGLLSELISKVLGNPAYRDKARYFQNVIAETKGLDKATDVLEEAFQNPQTERLTRDATTLPFA